MAKVFVTKTILPAKKCRFCGEPMAPGTASSRGYEHKACDAKNACMARARKKLQGTEKQCTKCGVSKSIDQFNRWSASQDGLYPQCKECRAKDRVDNKLEEVVEPVKIPVLNPFNRYRGTVGKIIKTVRINGEW